MFVDYSLFILFSRAKIKYFFLNNVNNMLLILNNNVL